MCRNLAKAAISNFCLRVNYATPPTYGALKAAELINRLL
jgi:hypothetical protein